MDHKIFSNIFEFWRAVEALSPQQIPKVAPSDLREPVHNWEYETNPPWLEINFSRRPIHPSKVWHHSVYSAIYERTRFIEQLEKIIGKPADVYEERPTGQSCVFSIAVDVNGIPLVETFMISMAAWAFGVIQSHGLVGLTDGSLSDVSGLRTPRENLGLPPSNSGFSGFDIFMDKIRDELAWQLGHWPKEQPITQKWFDDFVNLVISKLKLSNLVEELPVQRIKSIQIRRPQKDPQFARPKTNDDDFLNSFFIKDLNRILSCGLDQSSKSLQKYLEPMHGITRVDIRQNRVKALEILNPKNVPQGCWPAEHPLVWSQQLAVNAMWAELAETSGTFAINGPPGTGKTTLLRDVVAAVVVERAKVLAKHGDGLLGNKSNVNIGNRFLPYYEMNPALSGFSVVVASSNNGAVENVSLELPKQDAIHSVWEKEVNAYADLASELLQEPAWALIAGKLGNKDNRNKFVNIFWWQKTGDDGKIPGLRERLDDIKEHKAKPHISWDDAVEQFNQAISAEQKYRAAVAKVTSTLTLYEKQLEELALGEQQIEHSKGHQAILQERIRDVQNGLGRTTKNLLLIDNRITKLRDFKPGFLEFLSTFGKSHRQWRKDLRSMLDEQGRHENERTTIELRLEILQKDKTPLISINQS